MIKTCFRHAALALTLAFCSPLTNAQAGETLNFSWPMNVGPLNPHLYSPNQMFAQNMVYEPLVRYQADGTVKPWLAQSWEISNEGRTYTFQLRDGVQFSNGEAFDAAAVKANIDAVLANRSRHAWLELANEIESADIVDSSHVRITLKHAYYPLLQELSLPRPFRFIAPSQFKQGGTKDGIAQPIGTGPWVLQETRLGEKDVFVRNDRYWGGKPAFDNVTVKVIPDPNSRAIAFETGDIDLIYGADGPISPDTFERFRKMGTYTTQLSQPLETLVLAINTNLGATKELAVRKAINHAVDKDKMIATVLYGTQQRADTLFAPNVPYANIGLKPYQFDRSVAEKLLEDAGWKRLDPKGIRQKDGKPLSIELCFIGTDAISKSMAEIVQADLGKIGIQVILTGEEESSILSRQRDGRFGMIFNRTWGPPYDPHAFVSSMRIPSHADYQAQLGLPDKAKIDQEIGDVLISTDEHIRQDLYRDILTRLHDEAVYLPLTYVTAIAVAKKELGPIPFGAMSSEIPFDQIKQKTN
ncbi:MULTISPECIES: nickel ABC transporter substrate-binding protein [Rhizobium/Agrobacterium group]|uniref:nickel ABC transporter substrate-binding protein n=1 Tax=Rhizobium/Agrobacterium group TaxID=227290 RepID=UPI00157173AB|nr:nickel ABC transporter, nickel/metallophore periplasmic binding protein [Allorhizobium ampelinum]NSZ55912.1 nickel ABC transporter, nickel/metallophore periplasmic binding protein [Agrobacterium vitis]NTA35163.1 nickel ABC transporter, nickel/metallophore periplasmic binding protein [Agrobacterium vitis]